MSVRALSAVTFLALLAGLCALSSPSPGAAAAHIYVVNTHSDDGGTDCNPGGHCTLWLAITAANNNPGADTILFDASAFPLNNRTVPLDIQLPFVDAHEGITIDGGSSDIAILPPNGFTPDFGLVFLSDPGQPAHNIVLKHIFISGTKYDAVQVCADPQGVVCVGQVSNVNFTNVSSSMTDQWGIDVLGGSITGVDFTDVSVSDTLNEDGIRFETSSGSITDISITRALVKDAHDNAINVVTAGNPGTIDGLNITDSSSGQGEGDGVYISGTAVKNVTIDGYDSEDEDTGVNIRYTTAADHISVTGAEFLDDTTGAVTIAPSVALAGPVSDITISGSMSTDTRDGISVSGVGVDNVHIENNIVGPDDGFGVRLQNLTNFLVGGSGNVIRGNTISFHSFGIEVIGNLQATISRNSTFGNVGLGIDLKNHGDPDGVTENDPGDGDTGANGLLNFPVLTGVTDEEVTGTACAGCLIELFLADAGENSHGQGRFFQRDAIADGSGDFTISLCQLNISAGFPLTATATDQGGNTSEFSLNKFLQDDSSDTCFPPTPTAPPTASPPASPSVTPTASPGGSQTATPQPTSSTLPTASPTIVPGPHKQGDLDCNGNVDLDDFLFALAFAAELDDGSGSGGCPDLGDPESGFDWGDVNCDGVVDEIDALYIVAHLAGVDLEPADADCVAIGSLLT